MQDGKKRCGWVGNDPLYVEYHDKEWGVPVHDDPTLYEFLILEGAQAGLSWLTVLRKRENYRKAFASFNPNEVATWGEKEAEQLVQNAGIIRNRLKISSAITNAQKFLEAQKEFGSFSAYQWQFVGGKPKQNAWADNSQVPALSPEAEAFSKDLKKRGFRFVGPTIIYAHMQATGMVNDHIVNCFRYGELSSRR